MGQESEWGNENEQEVELKSFSEQVYKSESGSDTGSNGLSSASVTRMQYPTPRPEAQMISGNLGGAAPTVAVQGWIPQIPATHMEFIQGYGPGAMIDRNRAERGYQIIQEVQQASSERVQAEALQQQELNRVRAENAALYTNLLQSRQQFGLPPRG